MHPCIVHVEYDQDPQNPADADSAWTLYSFNRRHRSFRHPEELGLGPLGPDNRPRVLNPGLRTKLRYGLAHLLGYYEHGDCLWFRRDGVIPLGVEFQWDGNRNAGLLVWEHDPRDLARCIEDREADADGFLEEYTAYCNGECYGFRVEEPGGDDDGFMGGFFDTKYLVEAIIESLAGRPFVTRGRLAEGLEDAIRRQIAKNAILQPAGAS